MMRKLKTIILTLIATLGLSMSFGLMQAAALPAPVFASASTTDACASLSTLDRTQDCGSSASKNVVKSISSTVVNVLSIIVGLAAVIMIVISGLRYITSNGDSNGVSNAKNGLIYALVGLVIASLAQFLVHFVLNRVG